MRTTLLSLFATGLLCGTLSAQTPDAPPKVIRIFREDIKEGRGPAHEKTEMKWAEMLSKNKYPNNTIALVNLTGPSQAWFLEGHESMASIGEAESFVDKSPAIKAEFESLDSQDAEYRSSSRSWIAVYQPEMSYHAQQLVQTLPKARYFNVILFRVRQEHDQEFADLAKTAVAALEKSMSDQPVATYQVVSGAPGGTYLLFEPTASLATLDKNPERSRAMAQAMGDTAMKRFLKTAGETIATEESLLFTINPRMSYMPKEFTAADPDFWMPAPAKPETKPVRKKASAAK